PVLIPRSSLDHPLGWPRWPADPSAIARVELDALRNLTLPAVTVRKQARLVVVELLTCLGGELEVRPFDDGIDWTGLLAEAAVNALHHVDIVAGGASRAVIAARTGLDGDCLRRADGLAELAGNAALLPIGIAA